MISSQPSSLSDFSKGRAASEPSSEPSRGSTVQALMATARSWLDRLVSFPAVRVLAIFLVGFAAGIAWQAYGGAARQTIAGWSAHLAWLAPAGASGSIAPDRLKAMSHALASARQSLDKLSAEISKAQDADAPRHRAAR
jgi:hypothetical protein